MRIHRFIPFFMALAFGSAGFAQTTEDAQNACSEAARLIAEDDIDGALEEANWCVESLKQLMQQATLAAFPDEIDGFVGGEVEDQSVMGMSMIERRYTKESDEFNVSVTTGVAGGGLAALAQMGMGLSGSAGKKMRIQKHTVVDMSDAQDAQFMVTLKSGGMLLITSSTLPAEMLLPVVKAFPIEALDKALMR